MNSPATKAPTLRRALAGATGDVIPFPYTRVPRDLGDLAAPVSGGAGGAPPPAAPPPPQRPQALIDP
jgi:hypothetical protein